jgi:hypothetical protein
MEFEFSWIVSIQEFISQKFTKINSDRQVLIWINAGVAHTLFFTRLLYSWCYCSGCASAAANSCCACLYISLLFTSFTRKLCILLHSPNWLYICDGLSCRNCFRGIPARISFVRPKFPRFWNMNKIWSWQLCCSRNWQHRRNFVNRFVSDTTLGSCSACSCGFF